MPVPAANIVFIVLAHIGGPLMSIPAPDQSTSQAAPRPISITDNFDGARGGDRIRYEITVTNPSPDETPVTVWLTLPRAVATEVQAQGAAVIAGGVAWKRQMAVGERRTYVVTSTVAPDAKAQELSVTACMRAGTESACTTTRDQVDTPPPVRRLARIASIAFGLLAVFGALWLHKRIRPEPLTPATADGRRPDLELPGGAPPA